MLKEQTPLQVALTTREVHPVPVGGEIPARSMSTPPEPALPFTAKHLMNENRLSLLSLLSQMKSTSPDAPPAFDDHPRLANTAEYYVNSVVGTCFIHAANEVLSHRNYLLRQFTLAGNAITVAGVVTAAAGAWKHDEFFGIGGLVAAAIGYTVPKLYELAQNNRATRVHQQYNIATNLTDPKAKGDRAVYKVAQRDIDGLILEERKRVPASEFGFH